MDLWQKSLLLWIGGGFVGALVHKKSPGYGAMMGAIIVGGFGDAYLERNDADMRREIATRA